MCRRISIAYGDRSNPNPGMVTPSGAPQNMTTDIPSTAVGNARGRSRSVSSHLFPLKSLRTMIQAIGSPTRMSTIVTRNAMLNEFHTAPSITDMADGSSRTALTRSQSVNTLVTTKTAGITMRQMNRATARASHALRTL